MPFTEHPGWRTRGRGVLRARGLTEHHTAGAKVGDLPSLGVLLNGRPGIPGPLCNVALGRATVRIIAAGTANHAGRGTWRGLAGNSSVVGIEGESTGTGDWTPFQRWAYPLVSLAIARACGFAAEMIHDHREWTTRKIDPVGFGRGELRQTVTRLIAHIEPVPPPPPPPLGDDMIVRQAGTDLYYILAGGFLSQMTGASEIGTVPVAVVSEETFATLADHSALQRAALARMRDS